MSVYRSFGSFDNGVSGRPFIIPSTSHSRVSSLSSSNECSGSMVRSIFRADRICLSQAPPMCDAAGGLNTHSISRCRHIRRRIGSLFSCLTALRSSLSAPTKFVPLSDLICFGFPQRAMNQTSALMKELVSREVSLSMCTALITRHVNIHPYLFSWLRPLLTRKEPKQSTPT